MNKDGNGHGRGCLCGCNGVHDDGHLHASAGEEPAVFSFRRVLDNPGEESAAAIVERQRCAVDELCAKASEEGAMIGHVKMTIVAASGMAWLSNTGDETKVSTSGDWQGASPSTFELSLAAILFNISSSRLREFANQAFGE